MDEKILREMDDTIHAKARLGIMALLVARGEVSFSQLKERLRLTDGNLGAHIRVLEEAGYLTVRKSFVGRRPRTTCQVTENGRSAYRQYIDTLERLIADAKGEP